jgi:hypothetical protein
MIENNIMWHGHARTGCFGQFRPQQSSLLKADPEKWLCTEPGSSSLDPSHDR